MARVLWLNGPFGVGKTTTARLLVQRLPGLRLFDPEEVGFMLRPHLSDVPVDDFQEWPSWRRLVPLVADELATATGQDLVAVQTVLVEGYWRELVTGLADRGHEVFHVVLHAAEEEHLDRIAHDRVEARAAVGRRLQRPAYDAARPWLLTAADLVVDTTDLTAEEVAARVAEALRPR